jgi:hypothetical protein
MSEFDVIENDRIEIEGLLRANSLALAKCVEPTAIAVRGSGSLRIQRARPSTRRAFLLGEQRTLIQRRAAIYGKWSALKMREETR